MQVLRKIAFPFSLLYGLVVYLRNLCYDTGVFPSRSFDTPTICIGNLSTGGTGKTPMIEWILKNLSGDVKMAVLSRGYKRRTRGFLIADPALTPEETGDEPLQIARKFPQTTVAVDGNRCRGILRLEERVAPEIILLDDAFQHRKVRARLNVLLTSFSNLYIDDWYLPTGNLRDHRGQAQRAQVIVVTKCPPTLDEEGRRKITHRLRPRPGQRVLFSYLDYGDKIMGTTETLHLKDIGKREVLLVTAIADPGPLLENLRKKGINIRHRNFPDHHYFTEREIREFNEAALVLTTEKDFTRMGGKVPGAYFIPVEHKFFNHGRAELLSLLKNL